MNISNIFKEDPVAMIDKVEKIKSKNKQITELEKEYPRIVKSVMEYIIQQKQLHPKTPLLDLISDFCFKKDIDIVLVGDAIANDVYFKSFIEKDCEYYNIIRTEKEIIEIW